MLTNFQNTGVTLAAFCMLASPAIAQSADSAFQQAVHTWSKAHNTWDLKVFREIYGEHVFFYGETVTPQTCLRIKSRYFHPSGNLEHKIISPIKLSHMPNGNVRADFTKEVTYRGKKTVVPAYIVMSGSGKDLRIVAESDQVTDQKQKTSYEASLLPSKPAIISGTTSPARSSSMIYWSVSAICLLLISAILYRRMARRV